MSGSKFSINQKSKILMMLAKKYRTKHPGTKWTKYVSEAGKMYRTIKKS